MLIGPVLSGSLTLKATDDHLEDVDAIATGIIASLPDRSARKRPRAEEGISDPKRQRQAEPDRHTGPWILEQMPGYDDALQSAKTLCGLVGVNLPMSEKSLKTKLTHIYQVETPHAQRPYDL